MIREVGRDDPPAPRAVDEARPLRRAPSGAARAAGSRRRSRPTRPADGTGLDRVRPKAAPVGATPRGDRRRPAGRRSPVPPVAAGAGPGPVAKGGSPPGRRASTVRGDGQRSRQGCGDGGRAGGRRTCGATGSGRSRGRGREPPGRRASNLRGDGKRSRQGRGDGRRAGGRRTCGATGSGCGGGRGRGPPRRRASNVRGDGQRSRQGWGEGRRAGGRRTCGATGSGRGKGAGARAAAPAGVERARRQAAVAAGVGRGPAGRRAGGPAGVEPEGRRAAVAAGARGRGGGRRGGAAFAETASAAPGRHGHGRRSVRRPADDRPSEGPAGRIIPGPLPSRRGPGTSGPDGGGRARRPTREAAATGGIAPGPERPRRIVSPAG